MLADEDQFIEKQCEQLHLDFHILVILLLAILLLVTVYFAPCGHRRLTSALPPPFPPSRRRHQRQTNHNPTSGGRSVRNEVVKGRLVRLPRCDIRGSE